MFNLLLILGRSPTGWTLLLSYLNLNDYIQCVYLLFTLDYIDSLDWPAARDLICAFYALLLSYFKFNQILVVSTPFSEVFYDFKRLV